MEKFNEDLFEAVTEIVASTMEDAEITVNAEGGASVAEYFIAIYKKLAAFDPAEDEKKAPKKPGKYEVYVDKSGEYRFSLRSGNGEIIAQSEGYKSKAACLKGIESVRTNAPLSIIVEPESK